MVKNRGSGEKGRRGQGEEKKGSKPCLAVRSMPAEFSLPSGLPSLFFFFLFFASSPPGSIGMLQVLLGLGSRCGKIEHVYYQGMLCCTPVRPKWCRSGAVGCEVQGASRASDLRLDVGVVGAGAGGLFLLQKDDLAAEGKGFPLWPGLGWGGNGPLLPAVKQGWQRLVCLCSPLFFFLTGSVLTLFSASPIRWEGSGQLMFSLPPSRTGPLQTAAEPRPGVRTGGARTRPAAAC